MSKTFLMCVALIVTVLMLVIYINQRKLIYYPKTVKVEPRYFGAGHMEQVPLNTADGLTLMAWYKKSAKNKPTIVYYHGNAGHLGYRMPVVNSLIKKGLGVLLVEYRGYADNPGKPTEQGLYQDGRAAMGFLKSRGVNEKCIVLYGESLGSGVATKVASEGPVGAVVLQAPFTSMVAMARHHYPWLVMTPWDKYDSYRRISQIGAPLMVIHGDKDKVVPMKFGRQLFDRAYPPKQFIFLKGRGHNNLWSDELRDAIVEFLDNNLRLDCN